MLESAMKDASEFVDAAVKETDHLVTSAVNFISGQFDSRNTGRNPVADEEAPKTGEVTLEAAEQCEREPRSAEPLFPRGAEQEEERCASRVNSPYTDIHRAALIDDAEQWEQERREAEQTEHEDREVLQRARDRLVQEWESDSERACSDEAHTHITDEELQGWWTDHKPGSRRFLPDKGSLREAQQDAASEVALEELSMHEGFDDPWGEAQQRVIDALEVGRSREPRLFVCPCCDTPAVSDDDVMVVRGRAAPGIYVCANCFLDANAGDQSFWHWYWHVA